MLPEWFRHVEAAASFAGLVPEYVVVIDTHDVGAEASLRALAADFGVVIHVVHVDEDGDRSDQRVWNEPRYHHMVWLRNTLLGEVRRLAPELFLSLDSDILIAESALRNLVQTAETYDAVGGKLYMSMGRTAPSYANLVNSAGLNRPDFDGVMAVDVIMAMKLMTPAAYAVDYQYHFQGEDIGWSLACRDKGLSLAWDGRVVSKHCMCEWELHEVDSRCGY